MSGFATEISQTEGLAIAVEFSNFTEALPSNQPIPRLPMPYKFEIYKGNDEKFRVRFKAPNGETMFSTQGYKQKASAKNAIASIKKNAPDAEVSEE